MTTRIETERLALRLPRLEDATAWSGAIGDPEVMRYIGGAVESADVGPLQVWVYAR
jgi:RimJ/RimL family protein N-acetyltransferase